MSLIVTSCSDSGVQGTSLYSAFKGLQNISPISPTAVKLTWGLDSKYTEYRLYENEGSNPIRTETFSTAVISNLQPGSTYSYMVSGYSTAEGEVFLGEKQSVTTYSRFDGIDAAGLALKSASEVKLTWKLNAPTAKYKVFYKKQTGSWNFSNPSSILEGQNEYTISDLSSGQTYCFFVVAEYLDKTSEPATTDLAAVDAKAPCQQITTQLVGLPSVNINNVVPGTFPWFWTSSGDPSYKTEVYEYDTNVRVASRTGNGTFRSFINTPQGVKRYYALVTDTAKNVARLDVGSIGNLNTDKVFVRSLNATGNLGPIYPPVLAAGRGQQNLGNSIVSGDFNCDGLTDIAVGAYTSVPFATDKHYSEIGSVSVYYSWQPPSYVDPVSGNVVTPSIELKTNAAPSASATFPNPQLITYPVTSGSVQLGRKLATGNFNGDCYNRNDQDENHPEIVRGQCDAVNISLYLPSPTKYQKVRKCDDLVIGSAAGYFYVLYGDPNNGLVAGSMSNTAGEDELTCDASSSTCRAARYKVPTGYDTTSFAKAMTGGDFNNDGYSDIAVAAGASTRTDILVYRGSPQGIVPFGNSKSHANINPLVGTSTTTLTYIPLANKSNVEMTLSDDFGISLGTAFNSRRCVNNSPAGYVFRTSNISQKNGYQFTKCDDLVVGASGRSSNRGSIFSCKAATHFGSSDPQRISSWTCMEHFPTELIGQSAKYGFSILGVPNQNGYPMASQIRSTIASNALPDVTGAVFVGAPVANVSSYSQAGKVYGYYVTPTSADYTTGGIQGILGAGGHLATAVNAIPCDATNTNVTIGSLRACENQVITASPINSGAQFGYSLGTVPDRVTGLDPWMPMLAVSAPYRSTTDENGFSISQTGTVFLFRGDISTFMNILDGTETITSPKYNADSPPPSNPASNKTWYSGGISPYGPTIMYPKGLTTSALFGKGGIVGGSFNGDAYADVIATALDQSSPSSANGGIYAFFSSQGTFNPSVNNPDIKIDSNHSLEGNYRFEEAQVMGDINGDGYDDVVSHLNSNGRWLFAVYYGSASGLIKTPDPSFNASGTQPRLIKSISDNGLGKNIYRIGDTNADGFDDILVLGSSASYIYFGSSSGLVANTEPDISPIGKNPFKFALSGGLQLNNGAIDSYNTSLNSSGFNSYVQGVTFGRFNDDEYNDFAIRYGGNISIPVGSQNSSLSYATTGRVVVIYGGANGPHTNRITGRINLSDDTEVVTDNPCDSATKLCKVQIIASPEVAASASFGFAVATRKGLNTATSDSIDGLLISNPTFATDEGRVYVYKGTLRGIDVIPIQTLVPRDLGTLFGYSVVEAGDINKDGYLDAVVSSGSTSGTSGITIFYGAKVGGANAYFGAGALNSTNFWSAPVINDNDRHSSSANPRPQIVMPNSIVSGDYLGRGLAALGDFNLDGYADIAVNVPNGDFTLSGTLDETGYIMIYFGSDTGLQSLDLATGIPLAPTPYPRCFSGASPVCEPFQVFLPNVIAYEYSTMGISSVGDINGDGLVDIVIGGFGRNHPGGKAVSSGVFYVLY